MPAPPPRTLIRAPLDASATVVFLARTSRTTPTWPAQRTDGDAVGENLGSTLWRVINVTVIGCDSAACHGHLGTMVGIRNISSGAFRSLVKTVSSEVSWRPVWVETEEDVPVS
ncbi:hypothetical protein C8034_v008123 [Colletotrichum sidae]|uniref:Uncharacterized protein n=1 Tax=Colletotrichum sidae TaxID=1347389 RepID=A0A4R8TP44_9PEZI|nr:hypothetical protein C8034_v008123 [Colletotrichum sidae]